MTEIPWNEWVAYALIALCVLGALAGIGEP